MKNGYAEAMTAATLASPELDVSPATALWRQYATVRDRATRDQLIEQYAPLVKYVAGRLRIALPATLDFGDILGFGTIGLIEAVDRFDPYRGIKFETYAIPRIRGAIIDAIRSLDIVPRSVRDKARAIERGYHELFHRDGRMPTEDAVAAHLDIPLDQLRKSMQDATCTMLPLSGQRDDDAAFEDFLADDSAIEPADAATRGDAVTRLAHALEEIGERDRLVISLYYYEELTMKEISEVLGLTESRISQLLTRARLQLKVLMQEHGLGSFDLSI
jgi:RNA polymerase sigma factor for flagellar operon FliA